MGMFAKVKRPQQDFYLQITSLIDTLVIILVFMLMTIGSGTVELEMAPNLSLPWSTQGAELTQGLKLVARGNGIYIDEQLVAPLSNATVTPDNLAEAGQKIVPLFNRMLATAVKSKKEAEKNGVKFEGKVLFQADKSLPLKTIRQIMYTAARAGFNDFKFAVIRQ